MALSGGRKSDKIHLHVKPKHQFKLKGGRDMAEKKDDSSIIDCICIKGALIRMAERYIKFCLTGNADRPRLPNICGFFRWLKLGACALDLLKQKYPDKFRTLQMLFEDEALNSPLPPSIVSTYMRQQSYTDLPDVGQTQEKENDGITVVFDHDIINDGK